MPGNVHALRRTPATLEEFHAVLDQGIAHGARAGVLILAYPEDQAPEGGTWEAFGTDGMNGAERTFIYQQLILIEISSQDDGGDG